MTNYTLRVNIRAKLHSVNVLTIILRGVDMRTLSYLAFLEVELLKDAGWEEFTLSFYSYNVLTSHRRIR